MIIIEPCAGLGNRFIALASAYHAAKELNQKLVMIWKEETVLGSSSKNLFSVPDEIEIKEISEYGMKLDWFGTLRGNSVKKKYRDMSKVFFECDQIMNLYNEQGKEGVKKALTASQNVYIKATNPFWNIFDMEGAFDFIKPNPEIIQRRNQVLAASTGKKLVGVHIRRTDHIESIQNSPLELFIGAMKEELNREPDTYFYLASDDPKTEEELIGIFGDRIITFSDKCLKRDTVSGIRDAYVEMLCLAAGSKIFGSFNSTFSVMSAKFGNIPLIVIKAEPEK